MTNVNSEKGGHFAPKKEEERRALETEQRTERGNQFLPVKLNGLFFF